YEQLIFMKRYQAAFACTSYEYADEEGIGLGKFAHVPERITYEQAIKNTIIFTSTVLLDLSQLPKDEIQMPEIESEDTATWWKILRGGHVAYGLDQALVRYRRPAISLSSNKIRAIRRVWHLYRSEEQFSIMKSAYCFVHYAVRATLRRL
ncbi:MAG: glycosyltransferase family 2 protein, partial [Eubacteriales bacterium]